MQVAQQFVTVPPSPTATDDVPSRDPPPSLFVSSVSVSGPVKASHPGAQGGGAGGGGESGGGIDGGGATHCSTLPALSAKR
eukprot:2215930-Prymnesium_polylepis.2